MKRCGEMIARTAAQLSRGGAAAVAVVLALCLGWAMPAAAQTISDSPATTTWNNQVTAAGRVVETSTANYTLSGSTSFGSSSFTATFNAPIRDFQFRAIGYGTCCLPSTITYSLDGGPAQTFAVRNTDTGVYDVYLGLSGATPFTTITIAGGATGDAIDADSFAYGASPAPVPVPTMSEWAMILFGTVLAGGAALYIQRRRFSV